MENNGLRVQYLLNVPSNAILCFCLISLIYLFLLLNSSNLHTPTLECTNPIKAVLQQIRKTLLKKGLIWTLLILGLLKGWGE